MQRSRFHGDASSKPGLASRRLAAARFAALAFAGIVCGAQHAQGSCPLPPEPRDFQNAGDNLLTFDPCTGLQWLDLTETQGLSYDTGAARIATPGDDLFGFAFATASELLEFFGNAAIPDLPQTPLNVPGPGTQLCGGQPCNQVATIGNLAPVGALASLTGPTFGSGTVGFYDDSQYGQNSTKIGFARISTDVVPGNGEVILVPDNSPSSTSAAGDGLWLHQAGGPALLEVSFDNGSPGYNKQAPETATVALGIAGMGVIVGSWTKYRNSYLPIRYGGAGTISDAQLASLLRNFFFTEDERDFESLMLVFTGCFSGGFIDELQDTQVNNVGIVPIGVITATQHGKYSWDNELYGLIPGNWQRHWDARLALPASQTFRFSYKAAVHALHLDVSSGFGIDQEPQYYSHAPALTPKFNRIDFTKLGQTADQKRALIWVGDDVDGSSRAQRHYLNALAMQQRLEGEFGFSHHEIAVLFADGSAPPGAPEGLTIDALANGQSLFAFLNTSAIAGGDDQIFMWFGGHMGRKTRVVGGTARAGSSGGDALQGTPQGIIDLRWELGRDELLSATLSANHGVPVNQPFFTIGTITNLPPGEELTVHLAAADGSSQEMIGTVSQSGDTVWFAPSILDELYQANLTSGGGSVQMGFIRLRLEGPDVDPPFEIDGFEIGWTKPTPMLAGGVPALPGWPAELVIGCLLLTVGISLVRARRLGRH